MLTDHSLALLILLPHGSCFHIHCPGSCIASITQTRAVPCRATGRPSSPAWPRPDTGRAMLGLRAAKARPSTARRAAPGRPGTDVIVTVSGHGPTHVGRSARFTSLLLSGTPRVPPIGLAWTCEAYPPNGQGFPYLQEAEKHTPIV